MSTEEKAVLLDLFEEDGVARITLNRPERRNAINTALVRGVIEALERVRDNERIGCVMTVSAGGIAFCAGQDLYEMRERYQKPEKFKGLPDALDMHHAIRNFPKVTLAVVDGYCLGGGITLVCSHDLAIASDTAQFGLPEVIRGSYARNATAVLPQYVPLKKVLFLNLTGRSLDGVEAERAGLVSKVVPRDQLYDYSYQLAKEIADHSGVALEYGKKVAYASQELGFERGLELSVFASDAMRRRTDPLADVEGYLKSQKRGAEFKPGGYVRPSGL